MAIHNTTSNVTTHTGLVLSVGERNGYDDSDFYAVVWDEAAGKPVDVTYASTRYWSRDTSAFIDATPEVRAKADAWYAEAARVAAVAAAEREAKRVCRGRLVQVVKGRKVPVGLVGEVIWMGDGQWGTRVGIKDTAGDVHWTALTNVAVV